MSRSPQRSTRRARSRSRDAPERPATRRRSAAVAVAVAVSLVLAACAPAVVPLPQTSGSPVAPRSTEPAPPAGGEATVAAATAATTPAPTPASPDASTSPAPSAPPEPAPARPGFEPEPPPTASRGTTARLDRLLERFSAREWLPGVSATVIFADGTSWTGAAGLADLEGGTPVTPDTAFPLASISKTFLAALVLELSGEGRFRLDDRVARYLPELQLDPAITIRMLLDHTSGLRDFFEHRLIDRALQDEPSVGWSHRRALGYLDEPYFDPGTGWRYSNTNYLLLGVLVERVTGRPLAVELRERFLDPLELTSAWYQEVEAPRRPLAHGYRMIVRGDGFVPQDLDDGSGVAPFRSVVTAAGGAGSLAADSRDVARWARALYGGDAIDDDSLAIMLSGVDAIAGYQPEIPYGLGVQALAIAGHRSFGHSGRFLGFRASMRWLPDAEVAIGVLTNQSRAQLAPLVERIVRVILPEPGACPCPRPV